MIVTAISNKKKESSKAKSLLQPINYLKPSNDFESLIEKNIDSVAKQKNTREEMDIMDPHKNKEQSLNPDLENVYRDNYELFVKDSDPNSLQDTKLQSHKMKSGDKPISKFAYKEQEFSTMVEESKNIMHKYKGSIEYSEESRHLEEENIRLNRKIAELEKRIEILTKSNTDLECKLRQAQLDLLKEKKNALALENSLVNLQLSKKEIDSQKHIEEMNKMAEDLVLEGYKGQIKSLEAALDDSEIDCTRLLKEKKEKLIKERVSMCSLTLVDYINKSNNKVTLIINFRLEKIIAYLFQRTLFPQIM